mmetsp:Transcript_79697/g.221785  ORF Transcript_79697/g.221785 Transcript_79697/m.221785 type:complete len:934 (-) Transcript_79697:125-2926(-)
MASGDGAGAKDFVEGWVKEGKPLDRIMRGSQLLEIQSEIKREETKVSKQLTQGEQDLAALQAELNACNEQCVEQQQKLKALRSQQTVTLDTEKKMGISRATKETIDRFLTRRPREQDESQMTTSVDVHFLPGEETTGSNLHIGGEGAGSRDANFTVQLNEHVETLAKQAAKYWGLDANKVFFLDRDGRIVPDKMLLSDIILPPLAPASEPATSHSAASAPATGSSSALATLPEGGALDVHGKGQEAWTVNKRNYTLTLVRATTVLDKQDLSKPKGEVWNDFTFKLGELTAELEATRKKREGLDGVTAREHQSLDQIPSLYDLIQLGLQKKRMKMADTRCRWVEFLIFLLSELLFIGFVLLPDSSWAASMRLSSNHIDRTMGAFTYAEQKNTGIRTMEEGHTFEQYYAWLDGPVRRSVVGGQLKQGNLHVIGVFGYIYTVEYAPGADVDNWCETPTAPDTMVDNDSNATLNETCGNSSNATGANNTGNCSVNATAVASVATTPEFSMDGSTSRRLNKCVPRSLFVCQTWNTIAIFRLAMERNGQVPDCQIPYKAYDFETYFSSFAEAPLAYVQGKIHAYVTDDFTIVNTTDDASWDAARDDFYLKARRANIPAMMLLVLVYNPSLNGCMAKRYLMEKTLSGSIVMSSKTKGLHLTIADPFTTACYIIIIILAIVCFAMELRRIAGWPKRWSFEDERDKCNSITLVFALLPVALLMSFIMYQARFQKSADDLLILGPDNMIEEKTLEDIAVVEVVDRYHLVMVLVVHLMFNMLFFRYLLMYFPQLTFLTVMVKKVTKPLISVLTVILLFLSVVAFVFYALYSTKIDSYRNLIIVLMSTFRFAHGGLRDWLLLKLQHPAAWLLLMMMVCVMLPMILNHLPVAVMLSHKREKELQENYSYHTFWASARSQVSNPMDFNPALAGYDFTGPEPVKVTTS